MTLLYFNLGLLIGLCLRPRLARANIRLPRFLSLRPKYATVEIKTVYIGSLKIHAIKAIRSVTGFGLREAKDTAEGRPTTLPRETARALVDSLRELGVGATFTPTRRAGGAT